MPRGKVSGLQIAEAILKTGGNIYVMSKLLGCERQTIYNAIQKHPVLQQLIIQERERRIDWYEVALDQLAEKGNTQAIIFFLKNRASGRGYSTDSRRPSTEYALSCSRFLRSSTHISLSVK